MYNKQQICCISGNYTSSFSLSYPQVVQSSCKFETHKMRFIDWTSAVPLLRPAIEVWGKVIFSQAFFNVFMGWVGGVWLPSMHHRSHDWGSATRGVCLQGVLHPGGSTPRGFWGWGVGQIPPQDTWDTVNKQAVRILLECILVSNRSMDVFNDWKEWLCAWHKLMTSCPLVENSWNV